ncbi:MAG: hypothetical protein ACRD96_15845 [Bryobacteraceae bacterium]
MGVAVVALVGAGIAAGQEKREKKVKDQQEYDLFNEIGKTADPSKRLGLLDTWKQKYPETDFKEERLQFYLGTYQALQQGIKMAEVAKEWLALDPKAVTALYWLTLLTETLPPTPDSLATGEKAAQGLLAAQKPEAVKPEDWAKLKTNIIAYKTLGFIGSARKDFKTAEQQYTKVLELEPNFAEVSYALGMAIFQQKDPDRQPAVLFHWGRAASLTGVGQFPDAQRQKFDAFFVKAYNTYHGSADGIKEVRAATLASALPPRDFNIESIAVIRARSEKEFADKNPQLALWMTVKNKLISDGQPYFDSEVKGAAIPKLRGTVVSTKPAARPKEIVVGIEKPDVGEVTLVLETAMTTKADPGTEIEFEGVPSSFNKEPFMVTFDVEGREKISGWPAPAPAVKKAATKKAGATKKK